MKKYLIGITAIILAIVGVAFKAPSKPLGTKLFRYQPPSTDPYSQDNVEENSNWSFISSGSENCPTNSNEKACELLVDDSQVDLSTNTLKSTMQITAAILPGGQANTYYVSSASSSTIHNRPY